MKRNISNRQELADSSSNEVSTAKSPKLDKNDTTNTASTASFNELPFNFSDTPYYKLTKSDNRKVNINLTCGYIIIKINDINNLIEDVNKLIPAGPSSISGYYRIPIDSIKVDFLRDCNNYLEIRDIKLVYLTHGNELFSINNYNSNFLGFTAVICINNTGRSMVMVKHCCGRQHAMKNSSCLIARSFYTINILPQIIGSSMYLVVYLTTTEKFNNMWPKVLSINKDKDSISYLHDTREDNYLVTASNIERNIYKNVEAFILNSVLMEDLKSRLHIIKQLNSNIDSIFHHNDNTLISDILKRSTDSTMEGMGNIPVISDLLNLEQKRSINTKKKIRDKLLKAALNSKDMEEILSSIPSEEGTLEQLKFNQNFIYEHYKKFIENTSKGMDIGCRSLEHSYIANLYKIYGQNEYMITYILALINRVNVIMETLKHSLVGLDEFTVNNINSIILDKTEKNKSNNML
ncbi:hypothetical protein ChPV137 [Cheloniid poxvirus 1]|nr:hypothetical protein ChPV137 [Cheloniid poxvirus 1]